MTSPTEPSTEPCSNPFCEWETPSRHNRGGQNGRLTKTRGGGKVRPREGGGSGFRGWCLKITASAPSSRPIATLPVPSVAGKRAVRGRGRSSAVNHVIIADQIKFPSHQRRMASTGIVRGWEPHRWTPNFKGLSGLPPGQVITTKDKYYHTCHRAAPGRLLIQGHGPMTMARWRGSASRFEDIELAEAISAGLCGPVA